MFWPKVRRKRHIDERIGIDVEHSVGGNRRGCYTAVWSSRLNKRQCPAPALLVGCHVTGSFLPVSLDVETQPSGEFATVNFAEGVLRLG